MAKLQDTEIFGKMTVTGNCYVIGDKEIGSVGTLADPEGVVMQIDYDDANTSSRLFFRESHNSTYGASIIYAGAADPVFDGTTFAALDANILYFLTHTNSLTGTVFMSIDRGSTTVDFPGDLTVSGGGVTSITGDVRVLNASADEARIEFNNPSGSTYIGQTGATSEMVTGTAAGDYVISNRTSGGIVFSADESYADIHMKIDEDGDTRCNVNNYFDIKPATDVYGLIVRDSGSDSYYVNMKNVNGDVYIGDSTSTNADMLKIAGTAVTVPGNLTVSGNDILAHLAIGSANAQWTAACLDMWGSENSYGQMFGNSVANDGVYDPSIVYTVPLPCNRGGLSLYIAGTRVHLNDADGSNFVTNTYIYGIKGSSVTMLDSDTTDKNSVGEWEDLTPNVNMSTFDIARIYLNSVCASDKALEVAGVSVQYYYT